VYAPHVYTYAFTKGAGDIALTAEDLLRSNANARDEAIGYRAPLVIGEWGFDPKLPNASDYVRFESEAQDMVMASSFFWVWKEESQGGWGCFDHEEATDTYTERANLKSWLARVRPLRIAGFPRQWSWDVEARRFSMTFYAEASVTAPH